MLHAKIQKDLVILSFYTYFAFKSNEMNMHTCLICIGSNTCSEKNMRLASTELQRIFPDIRFGTEMLTEALFFKHNRIMFRNQLGVLCTTLSSEEIKGCFKRIETLSNRTDYDKTNEIVRLDIDLLIYDNITLKPKDLQRDYIKQGMRELGLA